MVFGFLPHPLPPLPPAGGRGDYSLLHQPAFVGKGWWGRVGDGAII